MKLPKGGNYLDPKPTRLRRALNLRPHKHSGRRLDHAHTSYAGLTFIWLIAGLVMLSFSVGSRAETLTAPPGTPLTSSGAIGVGGIVPGPPPHAARINTPTNGQSFSSVPIIVSGSCDKQAIVEIFDNDAFVGSVQCSDAGLFTLEVDLSSGQNILVAKSYDSLNQVSPDSNKVTIQYNPPVFTQPPSTAVAEPFRISSPTGVMRTLPNKPVTWTFTISGGKKPYAVVIKWGDGTDQVVSRNEAGEFTVTHTYPDAGTYVVQVQASDSSGQVTYIQVVTVVNGQVVAGAGAEPREPDSTGTVLILWPLYGGILLMIIAFWLGKRWRDKEMEKKGILTPQPV